MNIIERDGQQYLVTEITTRKGTVVVETPYNPDYVPPEPEPPQPTPEQLRIEQLENESALLAMELVETQIRLEQSESEHAALLLELVEKGVI
ncbi:hypothetical protein KP806_07535 [Paenibacillus sp. N4]|uniref:hypothetical protein n=1 Tax=Paenibacillus vietnamensis TaxID=2590547 RepID=UPI001CD066EC|nr:hypothetical protein [Paenibacillus vietnamensis]MCA0754898.1 hypothetical protein [Paenibacillus vietnamensis]